jgi:hypothetical protein
MIVLCDACVTRFRLAHVEELLIGGSRARACHGCYAALAGQSHHYSAIALLTRISVLEIARQSTQTPEPGK